MSEDYNPNFQPVISPSQGHVVHYPATRDHQQLPNLNAGRTLQNGSVGQNFQPPHGTFMGAQDTSRSLSNGVLGPSAPSPFPLNRFFRSEDESWNPLRNTTASTATQSSFGAFQQGSNLNGNSPAYSYKASSDCGSVAGVKPRLDRHVAASARQRGGSFSGNTTGLWQPSPSHLQLPSASPTTPDGFSPASRPGKRKSREGDIEGAIPCDHSGCEVVSRTQSQLRKHLLQHDRPFKCPFKRCGKAGRGFPTRNDLHRHIASVHHIFEGGMKTFICCVPDCGQKNKLWPRQDNFDNHVQKLHKLEKEKGSEENDRKRMEIIKESTHTVPPEGWDLSRVIKNLNVSSLMQGTNPYPIHKSDYAQPPTILVEGYDDSSTIYEAKSASDIDPQFQTMSFGDVHHHYGTQSEISIEDLTSHANSYDPNSWLPNEGDVGIGLDSAGINMDFDPSSQIPMVPPKPSKEIQSQEVAMTGGDLEGPRSPQNPLIFFSNDSNDLGSRHQFLNELAQELAGVAGHRDHLSTPITEAIYKILHSRLPNVNDPERLYGNAQDHNLFGDIPTYPKRVDTSANKPHSDSWSTKPRSVFKCTTCSKHFKSNAKRRKHEKRHKKMYGCTFPTCKQQFGSKSDWKRHENSLHYSKNIWVCNLPRNPKSMSHMSHVDACKQQQHPVRDASNFCGQKYFLKDGFENHLQTEHQIANKTTVDIVTQRQHIVANHQGSFWCGFCCTPVKLEKMHEEAWDERFNHIEKHFLNEHRSSDDWIPPGETKTKGEILRATSRAEKEDDDDDDEDDDEESGEELDGDAAYQIQGNQANKFGTNGFGNHVNMGRNSSRPGRVLHCLSCGDGPHNPDLHNTCPNCFRALAG